MSTFDSTKTRLETLLKDIITGEIQLPDFQRGWVWDDEHIRSLLVNFKQSPYCHKGMGVIVPSLW